MKKYLIINALALKGGHLLLEKDEVYAEAGLNNQIMNVYDPAKRKQIGYTTTEKFEAAVKVKDPEKVFVNGFESWIETFTELILYINDVAVNKPADVDYDSEVFDAMEAGGFMAARQLAEQWTDEFEQRNQGREWDGEFYEEAEAFAMEKDLGVDASTAATSVQRKILTIGTVLLSSIDDNGEQFDITDDQKNTLVDEDLIHYRSDLGWRYFEEDKEAVKRILNPQPFQDESND